MEEAPREVTPRGCAEYYRIRHRGPTVPGQMELAQPFQAYPSRRRKTLISNRGRWSSLSLFRHIHLGEGNSDPKPSTRGMLP